MAAWMVTLPLIGILDGIAHQVVEYLTDNGKHRHGSRSADS